MRGDEDKESLLRSCTRATRFVPVVCADMPPARKPPLSFSSIVHRGIVTTLFGITVYGMAVLYVHDRAAKVAAGVLDIALRRFYFQPADKIRRGRGARVCASIPRLADE